MTSLNQRQQKALRKRLTERRRQIVQDIREALARSDAELAAKLSDRVRDAGDESVADFLEALDAALVDRDVQELRDIEAALRAAGGGRDRPLRRVRGRDRLRAPAGLPHGHPLRAMPGGLRENPRRLGRLLPLMSGPWGG
ncbi:MAG: hypothetical protein KatS3mg123_0711 [Burkholderiales bacterium]|nr:MAG: hypothetical protein KatS3mg123_0711 [Burkholderiales bacterium]